MSEILFIIKKVKSAARKHCPDARCETLRTLQIVRELWMKNDESARCFGKTIFRYANCINHLSAHTSGGVLEVVYDVLRWRGMLIYVRRTFVSLHFVTKVYCIRSHGRLGDSHQICLCYSHYILVPAVGSYYLFINTPKSNLFWIPAFLNVMGCVSSPAYVRVRQAAHDSTVFCKIFNIPRIAHQCFLFQLNLQKHVSIDWYT